MSDLDMTTVYVPTNNIVTLESNISRNKIRKEKKNDLESSSTDRIRMQPMCAATLRRGRFKY